MSSTGHARLKVWLPRLIAIGLGILLTVAIDRVVGFLSPAGTAQTGLLFGPNQRTRYDNIEFDVVVSTNNVGIRDHDIGPKSSGAFRVVVLGDSFTFGWGVELSEAWVKQMERRLRHQFGEQVEVINLGKPASFPRHYADVLEHSVTLFQPDLVIVAILQGDDMRQHIGRGGRPVAGVMRCTPVTRVFDRLTETLWPNTMMLISRHTTVHMAQVSDGWRPLAEQSHCMFDATMKQSFDRLDQTMKDAFLTGRVNPSLVDLAVRSPQIWTDTLDGYDGELGRGIEDMAGALRRIKTTADRHDIPVLAISVPYATYASESSQQGFAQLGYVMTPEMLMTHAPDEAVRQAASLAGVPFTLVTSSFRKEAQRESLFFHFDGHFNAAGNRVFAELVTPVVAAAIDSSPSRQAASESASR